MFIHLDHEQQKKSGVESAVMGQCAVKCERIYIKFLFDDVNLTLHSGLFSELLFFFFFFPPWLMKCSLMHAFQITEECASSQFTQRKGLSEAVSVGKCFHCDCPLWIKGNFILILIRERVNKYKDML